MPAELNRVRGSSAGTRGALSMTRWSWAAKNARKRRRISAPVTSCVSLPAGVVGDASRGAGRSRLGGFGSGGRLGGVVAATGLTPPLLLAWVAAGAADGRRDCPPSSALRGLDTLRWVPTVP